MSRRRTCALELALAAVMSLAWTASSPAATGGMRDVVVVGNSAAGTVSFLDGHTWRNLGSLNVTPDPISPVQLPWWTLFNQQEGGPRAVDDAIASPDGTKLYVSRANRGDVAAFDLLSHAELWTAPCAGFRCDHMALSPDASQLIVSATLTQQAQVLNTQTGAVVAAFSTGSFPHQNDYSSDGRYIFNESIGNVALPQALEALKGPRQLTVVDAHTFKLVRTCQLQHGLRPTVFLPSGLAYMELSYLNGFIEYDTNACKILRTINQPFSAGGAALTPDQYPLNSAHHGIALSGDGTKLCDVGTIDNYVAVLSVPSLTNDRIINVGRKPYWGQTSVDGNYCLVSNSDDNDVWVIRYTPAAAVAVVPVGAFPQRERLATVPRSVIAALSPATG
jgi:DNA-binding beta-propeller fold protein YncE